MRWCIPSYCGYFDMYFFTFSWFIYLSLWAVKPKGITFIWIFNRIRMKKKTVVMEWWLFFHIFFLLWHGLGQKSSFYQFGLEIYFIIMFFSFSDRKRTLTERIIKGSRLKLIDISSSKFNYCQIIFPEPFTYDHSESLSVILWSEQNINLCADGFAHIAQARNWWLNVWLSINNTLRRINPTALSEINVD